MELPSSPISLHVLSPEESRAASRAYSSASRDDIEATSDDNDGQKSDSGGSDVDISHKSFAKRRLHIIKQLETQNTAVGVLRFADTNRFIALSCCSIQAKKKDTTEPEQKESSSAKGNRSTGEVRLKNSCITRDLHFSRQEARPQEYYYYRSPLPLNRYWRFLRCHAPGDESKHSALVTQIKMCSMLV